MLEITRLLLLFAALGCAVCAETVPPVEVVELVVCCVLVVVVVAVEEAADASPNGQAPLGHRISSIKPRSKIQRSLCTR